MANPTLTLIASSTVGSGGASSVTFSSIPQTYTDLLIKCSVRGSLPNNYGGLISFNGSGSGFTEKYLEGSGSSVVSGSVAQFIFAEVSSSQTSNTFTNTEVYIPNYTSSNYKSVSSDSVTENNSTLSYADLTANLWSNTAAITSISITASTTSWVQYSTFYLYGISIS